MGVKVITFTYVTTVKPHDILIAKHARKTKKSVYDVTRYITCNLFIRYKQCAVANSRSYITSPHWMSGVSAIC